MIYRKGLAAKQKFSGERERFSLLHVAKTLREIKEFAADNPVALRIKPNNSVVTDFLGKAWTRFTD